MVGRFMCWAFFFMGWGNKIWLAPKLEVLLPKTTAHPPLTHQLAITKSNGINWKKLLKIKTVVAADKINNYFCLEVNYSCGHQFYKDIIIFPCNHQYHQDYQKKNVFIPAELHEKRLYSDVFLPYIPLYSYCLLHNISIIYAFKPS